MEAVSQAGSAREIVCKSGGNGGAGVVNVKRASPAN